MKRHLLAPMRSWNWKVFIVLAGSIILAAYAIVPYSLHNLQAYDQAGTPAPGWGTVAVNGLINSLIVILIGGLGLLISNRIGTGLPLVECWVGRKPGKVSSRKILAVGLIAGVGIAAAYLFLQDLVFGPPMEALFKEIGYTLPDDALPPPLYGLFAAFSAGITEETIFRLFGLSALAWLGGLAFHDPDKRPKLAVFWIANIVFALAFGFMHLPDAASRGWPINSLIIVRTVMVNGIGGLVLGWLYWSNGLETAMLAHFLGDAILYSLIPFIATRESGTANIVAASIAAFCILLALAWAVKTVVLESRITYPRSPDEFELKSVSNEMHL